MKPGKLDLPPIWRGCDWGPVIFKWKDKNGLPINLSGWLPVAHSLNIDLKPEVTDVGGGVVELTLTNDDTSQLKLGVENWDWIWQRIEGQYRYPPFLSGQVEIKNPISPIGIGGVIGLPPENNNFADAIRITGLDGSATGTNVNATRQNGEPPGESTVWYYFTPIGRRSVTLHIGMDWLLIGVYRATTTPPAINHLTFVAQSTGNPMMVHFIAETGINYYIRLSKRTRESAFNLVWHITSAP
jgi:hypothetical protein